MLVQLSIRNVVLIDQLVVEFGAGFHVLTGETGAGKSMIVDALALVLGARANPELVRAGAKEAEIEALFEVLPGSRLAAKLEAWDLPGVSELVIRRVVQADGAGRSRAFLNGRIATAAQLVELAPELCDIASQHESVALTDPATHGQYLDAFGELEDQAVAVARQVEALLGLGREIEELRARERTRLEREDFLEFQLREIEDLDVRPGEEGELEQERGRLRHAGRLGEATRKAADRIYEGDEALCDALARIVSELEAAAGLDGALAPLARNVENARAELADAARELARYADGVETNPARLDAVEERLFRLQKLLRKYGPATEDLLRHRDDLRKERAQLAGGQERFDALCGERDALLAEAATAARKLSAARREAAARLADAIGRELGQLGMGRARVVVDVSQNDGPSGIGAKATALAVDGARLGLRGLDRVEFLIAPNKGEEPRPLRKIASGGELSRALLALKRVLAENGPAGLYVFDEVDAGVSGAIAEVIGRSIAEVARHRQVLCITHLPQIAALADHHFVVGKREAPDGRTYSTVRPLDEAERIEEVARMIGGVRVGDAAKQAAAELLEEGRSRRDRTSDAPVEVIVAKEESPKKKKRTKGSSAL
jgi:DNA repair protein RecN (Recombination protein N)